MNIREDIKKLIKENSTWFAVGMAILSAKFIIDLCEGKKYATIIAIVIIALTIITALVSLYIALASYFC